MKEAKLIGILAIGCLGILPSAAQAKAPTETNIAVYGGAQYSATRGVIFGQVFAGKPACVAKRKFNLVLTKNGNSKVVDSGKASAEGGIAGSVRVSELSMTSKLSLATPQTPDCKKASAPLVKAKLSARPKPAESNVIVVGADGQGKDLVVVGVVASTSGKCVAGRKVKLIIDGIKRDSGTTSKHGAFGLHITQSDVQGASVIKVSVKGDSTCSGGSSALI